MSDQSIIEDVKASLLHEEEHLYSADMVDDFLNDPIAISVFTKFAQLREARSQQHSDDESINQSVDDKAYQGEPVAWLIKNAIKPDGTVGDDVVINKPDVTWASAYKPLYAAPQQVDRQQACLAPSGWKLVPINPTKAMLDAGFEIDLEEETPEHYEVFLRQIYSGMLSASPTTPIGHNKYDEEK
jgi:hypothetical protein